MLDVAFLQSKDVLVRFTGDYELALCYTAATVVADCNTNRSVVTVCNELFCKHSKLAAIFNVQFSHWATTFLPNCKEVDILFSFDCD